MLQKLLHVYGVNMLTCRKLVHLLQNNSNRKIQIWQIQVLLVTKINNNKQVYIVRDTMKQLCIPWYRQLHRRIGEYAVALNVNSQTVNVKFCANNVALSYVTTVSKLQQMRHKDVAVCRPKCSLLLGRHVSHTD